MDNSVVAKRVTFKDIFSGDFLPVITRYSQNIQSILDEYSVVIFMARKAICFYQAMVVNHVVEPRDECRVFSSRVLEYNIDIIKDWKSEKVAVIDDIVVHGESIAGVLKILTESGIKAHVLVAACEESKHKELIDSACVATDDFAVLEGFENYTFAGLITKYIESSMCPFNIDQPIYTIRNDNPGLRNLADYGHMVDISSSNQYKYGISSNVIYFDAAKLPLVNSPISIMGRSILKARILQNDAITLIVPFVLPPKLSNRDLDNIFYAIFCDNTEACRLADVGYKYGNKGGGVTRENKLKILGYFLSEALGRSFLSSIGIKGAELNNCDIYQFSRETKSIYGRELNLFCREHRSLSESLAPRFVRYRKFSFPSILGECYQAMGNIVPSQQKFLDAMGRNIDKRIVTYDFLLDSLATYIENRDEIASCVIDILIDRGFLVPSVVHASDGIIRAYKMGEYSHLEQRQFELFLSMLCSYMKQKSNKSYTERRVIVEKLLVLFFQDLLGNELEEKDEHGAGDYRVVYAMYGPLVADTSDPYVKNNSIPKPLGGVLREKGMLTEKPGGYAVTNKSGDVDSDTASDFAKQYAAMANLFASHCSDVESTYIKSFEDFLVLQAIGPEYTNQYLALCAELSVLEAARPIIFTKPFSRLEEEEKGKLRSVFSAVRSGIWKYESFINGALYEFYGKVRERYEENPARYICRRDKPRITDTRAEENIRRCGELLYRAVYFMTEFLLRQSEEDRKSYCSELGEMGRFYSPDKNIYRDKDFDSRELKIGCSNAENQDFFEIAEKDFHLLQKQCGFELDLCDLLGKYTLGTSYHYVDKILAKYSPEEESGGDLALEGFNVRKVTFDLLENKHKASRQQNDPEGDTLDIFVAGGDIISDIFKSIDKSQNGFLYFLFDMSRQEEGMVYILDKSVKKAAGRYLAEMANNIIRKAKVHWGRIDSELYIVSKGEEENPEPNRLEPYVDKNYVLEDGYSVKVFTVKKHSSSNGGNHFQIAAEKVENLTVNNTENKS